MRYELCVPQNKKSSIFVILRGSSKNNEIGDFWFFGKAGLKDWNADASAKLSTSFADLAD